MLLAISILAIHTWASLSGSLRAQGLDPTSTFMSQSVLGHGIDGNIGESLSATSELDSSESGGQSAEIVGGGDTCALHTMDAALTLALGLARDGTLLRYFLASVAEWLAHLSGVVLYVRLNMPKQFLMIKYNYLAIAVVVSSFGKLLLPLSMIWDYDILFFRFMSLFVITSNTVAVSVFLDTTMKRAAAAVAVGCAMSVLTKVLLFQVGATDTLVWM